MKLNPFRKPAPPVAKADSKQPFAESAPPPTVPEQPRAWSLLLPPGFTNDFR